MLTQQLWVIFREFVVFVYASDRVICICVNRMGQVFVQITAFQVLQDGTLSYSVALLIGCIDIV